MSGEMATIVHRPYADSQSTLQHVDFEYETWAHYLKRIGACCEELVSLHCVPVPFKQQLTFCKVVAVYNEQGDVGAGVGCVPITS